MAHHKSAKKRIRQTVRRTAVNRARTSRVRTFLKKVEDAIATGNNDAARAAFVEASRRCIGASSRASSTAIRWPGS